MDSHYPKELIALAKETNWERIKEFIEQFILSTLKDDLPYNVILLEKNNKNKKKEAVKDFSIQNKKDIARVKQVNGFNTLSIYQSNEFISNNLYITKNNETIILMAKFMDPINIRNLVCFDFLMMIDSSNTPTFINPSGDTLESNEIIQLFKNYGFKKQLKNINEIKDAELEIFIFEQITEKNAIWGGEETKAFKSWKDKISDLYREDTGKYSYYGGNVTKNFRKYLEEMYELWKRLTNCGQKRVDDIQLNRFFSFLNLM
ncbi:MAG: hypothetical protein BAJALOKI3v1_250030 [Promethearchaeota archaeon]|nr:MAG: hypothetical protein BAJALOKI3v1_250030 [Candidatus Lokiarchaeota archaeon]